MDKTKLVRLFRTFTPSEFNEFGKFVNSPFHNESRKMVNMYNCFKKYYPELSDERFTKKAVFEAMYRDTAFDDKKMRDRLSDMQFLAEEYLAVVNLKKNSVKYKMHTLNEFSERNLAVHFDKKHREISTILSKDIFKNENSFYDDYILQSNVVEFYQNSNLLGKRKSFFDEIAVHIELFLKYFTAQMLKNYAVINNIKILMNFPYKHKFYEQVMKYIDENGLERYPLIKALRLIIKINENRDDVKSYFELKKLYLKNHVSMDIYDKTMIGTELLTNSRILNRAGKPGFRAEAFEMLKLQIELETYPKEKGYMKREQFLVSVDTAVGNGSIEWARQFINKYIGKIDPKLRENLQLWSAGILNIADKKYDLALREFSKIKLGDYIYYFWVKVPVAKIYFEMKEYDNVLMLIDSLKHYTAANKLVPEHIRNWYYPFFNMLHKLTMLAIKYDADKALSLGDEINSSISTPNAGKLWLHDKLKGLMESSEKGFF